MKDYVKEFKKRIAAIDKDSQAIRIINAGVMNHGKSSLFNSLLDREAFAEEDIRTTMVAGEALWFDDVYLVDTPGLNAEASDDAEAYATYRRANMIVFCHTAKVGELRAAELAAINEMKKLFPSDEFFWQHFCLAITFLDSDSPQAIATIKNKSLADVASHCGGKDFSTFLISNTRYRKGRDENKEALVKLSGVSELRGFLQSRLDTWRGENTALRRERIQREKEDIIRLLQAEKQKLQKVVLEKKRQVAEQQNSIRSRLELAISELDADIEDLETREAVLKSLNEDLEQLRLQHNRERY